MAGEKFRKQLKREAEQWQEEGLVSRELFQTIADRYEFSRLDNSNQLFSTILYCVGGILVGLAVITLVAANWQLMNQVSRVILLVSWLLGINTIGFHLWQRTDRYKRLGQGFLIVGGLSLGAVIALLAQIFNLSGPLYGLFLIWGVGVVAMGASLRYQTLTMMGLILLNIGYISYSTATRQEFNLIGLSMPLLSIALLTLAYWLESEAVFVLVTLLWIVGVAENIDNFFPPLSLIIPATILWGYNHALKLDRLGSYLSSKPMEPIGRGISALLVAMTLYWFSFRFSWNANFLPTIDTQFLDQLHFGLLAGATLYVLGMQFLARNDLTAKIYLGIVYIFALVYFLNFEAVFSIFITNALLAIFSIGFVRISIEKAQRRNFWFGIILVSLQILSRTFEYDTGLIFKALMLASCGVAILLLGMWFERYLQNLSTEAN